MKNELTNTIFTTTANFNIFYLYNFRHTASDLPKPVPIQGGRVGKDMSTSARDELRSLAPVHQPVTPQP